MFFFCSLLFLQISCYPVLLFTVCPPVFLIYTWDLVCYFSLPLSYSLLSFLLFSSVLPFIFLVLNPFLYSPLCSLLFLFSFVLPPYSYSPMLPSSFFFTPLIFPLSFIFLYYLLLFSSFKQFETESKLGGRIEGSVLFSYSPLL